MRNKIKTGLIIGLCVLILSIKGISNTSYASDMNNMTLKSGISLVEQVPNTFMGNWRVSAHLLDCTNPAMFKQSSIDIWNLSRSNDVIKLVNPFSGAEAAINLEYVKGNVVKFTKTGNYDSKILTDTVEIKLNGNYFTGINTLKLDTLSDVDNTVIKTDNAKYLLKGEKISGMSILGK
ncbi:MAG: hypothetical protein LKG27_04015 [Clostridiaceae bacterium]|jgi:hypothetical protein|nr:hypothetical protein [Clostridiaceae bacterium]